MTGAVIFTAALGCFLGGCLIAALATEPTDDGETHRSLGLGGSSLADELRRHTTGPNDWASGDDETFFHGTQNTEGRQ